MISVDRLCIANTRRVITTTAMISVRFFLKVNRTKTRYRLHHRRG